MSACNGFTTGSLEANVRNEPENIVRTDGVKIVTRYSNRRNPDFFDQLSYINCYVHA